MENEIEKKDVVDPSTEVDKLLGEETTAQPQTEPVKTETLEVKPVEEVVAPVVTEVAPEKPAVVAPATETQDKKYAGKYTNTFDLIEGVLEEVKALKGDKKEIATLVTEAQSTGDWSKVENKYKELQTQVVKQIQDSKKPAEVKPSEKPSEVKPSETDLAPEEFQTLLLDTTMRQISDSALSKKFEKYGVAIPTTQEALDELEIAYPTLWTQFTDTFRNLYSANKTQAEAFIAAEKEAPGYNETQKQTTKQQIEEFASEWKVELPADQIEAMILEAEKNDAIYENRNGVKFIRENAIFEHFMAKNARKVLEQVRNNTKVESLNQGRMEGIKDIEEAKKKVPQTLSTSSVPTSVATKVKEINWADPDEAKLVGREKIVSKLDELLY